MMHRRAFIGALAVGVAVSVARAQPAPRTYRIGILEAIPASENAANLAALRKALADLGYVEGRNLAIEYRSADGHAERFPALAAELVRLHVDLIVARGTPATAAAAGATPSIPVLMATMGDPHAIAGSYARPARNVTGVTTFSTEVSAKRVELLRELLPGLSRVALLHNLGNPAAAAEWEETKRAAAVLGVQAELLDVRGAEDIRRAIAGAAQRRIDGLVVGADGLVRAQLASIVSAVAHIRLPAVYPDREFVDAGGLMAYAVNYPELYTHFARYADRIFRGARPGDLPVEQPTRLELVINARTARALGLAIPSALLLRADDVIGR